MVTKNAKQAWRVYCQYGRGSLSYDEGIVALVALDVPRDVAGRVLVGTYKIAGH